MARIIFCNFGLPQTTLAQYKQAEFSVERRFSDFYWLHDKLKESFKGFIIPPMPEKTIIQSNAHLFLCFICLTYLIRSDRFDVQFIENRRRELGKFLKEVTEHPVLSSSEILQTFLESSDWEQEKVAKPQAGMTKKMFSWVSTTVNQAVSPATEIDEFFAKKDEYLNYLHAQMSEQLRISKLLSQKQNGTHCPFLYLFPAPKLTYPFIRFDALVLRLQRLLE